MRLSPLARFAALVTAVLALVSLTLRFLVILDQTGGLGPALWHMLRYFTILTNAMVILVFGAMAATGRSAADWLLAGLVLWIGAVAVIYQWLLSPLWEPQGINYLADRGLHFAVPIAVLLWWVAFASRARLTFLHPLFWLGWPVLYLIYVLIRSAWDGEYPYPFLDPARVAPQQLIWNVSRMLEAFLIGGYAIFGLSHLLARFDRAK